MTKEQVFNGHKFRKPLIDIELANPRASRNSVSNIVLEKICQVIGNPVRTCNINRTYVDEDEGRSIILTVAAFTIFLTGNSLKYHNPGQFIFVRDMILPIKYTVD